MSPQEIRILKEQQKAEQRLINQIKKGPPAKRDGPMLPPVNVCLGCGRMNTDEDVAAATNQIEAKCAKETCTTVAKLHAE